MSPLLIKKKKNTPLNQNLINLQQIAEEQDDCVLPLYRSVKVKGNDERICQIIRNPKVLESLIQKSKTI